MVFNNNLLIGAASSSAGGGGFVPAGAVVLDDQEYLTRTPGGAGNRRTWTYSMWIKRNQINPINYGAYPAAGPNASAFMLSVLNTGSAPNFRFVGSDSNGGNNRIRVSDDIGATLFDTTAQYGDDSAWYHIIFAFDSTQAVAMNRLKLYVNGSLVTDYSLHIPGNLTLNEEWAVNNTVQHNIGKSSGADYLYATISEVIMLDGYAASASDLGEFNSNGIWIPIDPTTIVTAQKGTNGFWLDFADTSDFGNDVSYSGLSVGTDNSFTASGLTAANTTKDRPATDSENDIGNYCTWDRNNLKPANANAYIIFQGNLRMQQGVNRNESVCATIRPAGKFYVEIYVIDFSGAAGGTRQGFGIIEYNADIHVTYTPIGNGFNYSGMVWQTMQEYSDDTPGTSYGNLVNGDYMCIAWDMDAGKFWARKNSDAWFGGGDPETGATPTGTFTGAISDYIIVGYCSETDDKNKTNFGSTAYNYTAPSGFGPLYANKLPEPAISDPSDNFIPIEWTGNATADTAIAVGFEPDFTLIKNNDTTDEWKWLDQAKGATKTTVMRNASNNAEAETTEVNGLTAFTATGFTLGTGADGYNDSGEEFLSYNWLGNSSATAVSASGSGDGATLAGTYRQNTTAGFSLVTYVGGNAAISSGQNQRVNHGLSAAPEFVIMKSRDTASNGIVVSTHGVQGGNDSFTVLNSDAATATGDVGEQNTNTSTYFVVGDSDLTNKNADNFVAYVWHSVEGYSKFGYYTGNGSSEGPFVYVGFKPALVLIKNEPNQGDWRVTDYVRSPFNPTGETDDRTWLTSNSAAYNSVPLGFYANGFKIQDSSNVVNQDGSRILYCAWAESPFASNNRAR